MMLYNPTNTKLSTTFLFAILILLFTNQVHAKVDSLQQVWLDDSYPDSSRFNAINEFRKKKTFSKPAAVIESSIFHYDLAQQKNSKIEIANALINKAIALRVFGKYDAALKTLNTLVETRVSMNDTIGLADSYIEIGIVYHYQSKYLDAVKYYSKSLALYQEKGMESRQTNVFNGLALAYAEINNFNLALEYFDKATQLAQKLNQEKMLNDLSLNIGFANYGKKNYIQAISNSKKVINFFETSNDQVGLADCYYLLAQSHQALNQIDTALFYIKKSLDINLSIGNPQQIIPTKILFANILFETNIAEATKIGEELLPEIDTSFGYAYLTQTHHLLYRCYKAKGNLPLALSMHEKYVMYNDSLFVEEDNLAITRQALQTEHEIELLNKQLENEQAQSALEYNQLKRTFAILLSSLFIIFLTAFYARSKILNQRREKENLLKEIKQLKDRGNSTFHLFPKKFQLERMKIEATINRKLNETDWKVLNILLDDPVISNKEIAQKAFLTVDGISSCLRRMYIAFDVKESKYKKISLIMKAIKLSNTSTEISVEQHSIVNK